MEVWLSDGPYCAHAASCLQLPLPFYKRVGPAKRAIRSNPLALDPGSSNTPTYCRWTKLGNVLILESPAGVGYSYCDDGSACGSTDESTADDTLELMANFFERYPEYAKHPVFLTGESYAGAAPDSW